MTAAAPALELRDVFRIFRSGPVETVAVRGVTGRIEPGEFVALVGPSGCGKSTVLHIAAGLDEPSAGSVWVAGEDLATLDEGGRSRARAGRIGIVYQRDNLWAHLSAKQNVAQAARLGGRDDADGRATRLLDALGLGRRAGRRPAALSGGEQQRAAIAVALVNEPTLLLADEPTGELDSASEQLVLEQLEWAQRVNNCALVVVTHSERVAARANRVIHMRDGLLR